MGDFTARIWGADNRKHRLESKNGEPIEFVFEVEDFMHDISGPAYALIRYKGKIQYSLIWDGVDIRIKNYPGAKWPILDESDEEEEYEDEDSSGWPGGGEDESWNFSESESDGDSENGGEGEGQVLRRIFGRFHSGQRWLKRYESKPDEPSEITRMRARFGFLDVEEMEANPRAKRKHEKGVVDVTFVHTSDMDYALLRVRLPEGASVDHERRTIDISIPAPVEP